MARDWTRGHASLLLAGLLVVVVRRAPANAVFMASTPALRSCCLARCLSLSLEPALCKSLLLTRDLLTVRLPLPLCPQPRQVTRTAAAASLLVAVSLRRVSRADGRQKPPVTALAIFHVPIRAAASITRSVARLASAQFAAGSPALHTKGRAAPRPAIGTPTAAAL